MLANVGAISAIARIVSVLWQSPSVEHSISKLTSFHYHDGGW